MRVRVCARRAFNLQLRVHVHHSSATTLADREVAPAGSKWRGSKFAAAVLFGLQADVSV